MHPLPPLRLANQESTIRSYSLKMDTAIRLTDSTIGKRANIWSDKGMFSPPATQPTEKCDWQVSRQLVCSPGDDHWYGQQQKQKPCKRAKHQHDYDDDDDDWPFDLTMAQFELYLELQEKGEFSMLELPSRRPDAFTADDVAEVVQHFPAMKEAWRRLKQ